MGRFGRGAAPSPPVEPWSARPVAASGAWRLRDGVARSAQSALGSAPDKHRVRRRVPGCEDASPEAAGLRHGGVRSLGAPVSMSFWWILCHVPAAVIITSGWFSITWMRLAAATDRHAPSAQGYAPTRAGGSAPLQVLAPWHGFSGRSAVHARPHRFLHDAVSGSARPRCR